MLLQYIFWDDWLIFIISGSNELLQQEFEYTLLKPGCHWWWISKMQSRREGTLEARYLIKFFFKLEKRPQKRTESFKLLFDHLVRIEHQFLCSIRDSKKAGSLWGMMRCVGEVRKSIHQSWLAKSLRLALLCCGFKESQDCVGRGQHFSNWLSNISTWTTHQSTTPSLSQTIWPRWASRHFITVPIVQILLSVTFDYSLSSEAVVMRHACKSNHIYPWCLNEIFFIDR